VGPTSTGGLVEALGKILLAIATLTYAVGVVIVTSDLAQYKVATFSLARSQYVLVGAMWLGMTIALLFFPVFCAFIASQFLRLRSARGAKVTILAIVGGTFVVTSTIDYVSPLLFSEQRIIFLFHVGVVAFLEIAIYAVSYSLWSIRTIELDESLVLKIENSPALVVRRVFGTVLLIFLLLLWIPLYTSVIFPYMDPSIGGGDHPSGRVVFLASKDQDSDHLAKAWDPISLNGLTTDKVIVVLVDTDFVVLVPEEDKSKSVLVSKGLIASIRYDVATQRSPSLVDFLF
jgi:hypothetical protein